MIRPEKRPDKLFGCYDCFELTAIGAALPFTKEWQGDQQPCPVRSCTAGDGAHTQQIFHANCWLKFKQRNNLTPLIGEFDYD
jgi:hypothetical protein